MCQCIEQRELQFCRRDHRLALGWVGWPKTSMSVVPATGDYPVADGQVLGDHPGDRWQQDGGRPASVTAIAYSDRHRCCPASTCTEMP